MIPIQDELHAWLALAGGSAAARLRARRLLQHFGGPLEIFHAGKAAAQAALGGLPLGGLFNSPALGAGLAERTRQWMAADHRHHVITLADARYPAALLNSPDPPLVLHAAGHLAALDPPAVAIVGSRHATPAGASVAARLASEVSILGGAVVSGLALGIDAAAHRGCLEAPGGGTTIAVVACGLHEVYPREHGALLEEIKIRGLILSEHPLGTPALPAYFPQRNRIIAGLGVVTVVVEATIRSGSLITARLALEAGRDVFAVPGHLSSPQSAGCNALIKGGAGLIESAEDLVAALPWAFPAAGCRPGYGTGRTSGRTAGRSGGRSLERSGERSPLRPQVRSQGWPQGWPQGTQPPLRQGAREPRLAPPAGRVVDTTEECAVASGFHQASMNVAFKPDPAMDDASWRRASALLRSRPSDLVELTAAADVPAQVVNRTLLLAELDGLVARLPGGLFQWCGPPA